MLTKGRNDFQNPGHRYSSRCSCVSGFMNGYAASNNAHGFYGQDNTKLTPVTDMLILRTGVYF